MQLQEFKAWLDGFSEAMGDAPTPEQWAKIKAKLAKVGTFQFLPGHVAPVSPNNPYRSPTSLDPQWGMPTVTCGATPTN